MSRPQSSKADTSELRQVFENLSGIKKYYVNGSRLDHYMLHEEDIQRIEAAIAALIESEVRRGRIDEAKRAANHNNSEYTSDYLEIRIAELEAGSGEAE